MSDAPAPCSLCPKDSHSTGPDGRRYCRAHAPYPCRLCGAPLFHTGKKGKPAGACEPCWRVVVALDDLERALQAPGLDGRFTKDAADMWRSQLWALGNRANTFRSKSDPNPWDRTQS